MVGWVALESEERRDQPRKQERPFSRKLKRKVQSKQFLHEVGFKAQVQILLEGRACMERNDGSWNEQPTGRSCVVWFDWWRVVGFLYFWCPNCAPVSSSHMLGEYSARLFVVYTPGNILVACWHRTGVSESEKISREYYFWWDWTSSRPLNFGWNLGEEKRK